MTTGAEASTVAPSRRGRRAPLTYVLPSVAAAAAVVVPLIYVFVRALEGGARGWAAAVFSPLSAELLLNTLLLVAGVLPLTLVLALPTAWLVARTDLPGRRVWGVLAALPLVFPSYLAAFTLVAFLGPRGLLQGWLAATLGDRSLGEIAYGYSGALIALGFFTYPYVYLLAVAALRKSDPALEESARSLGAGAWRRFADVIVPQLVPSMRAGGLLVVLYTLSDFGVVSIVRYNTYTLGIYNAYRGLFDRTVAAALATVLIVLTLAFLALEVRLGRRSRPTRTRPSRPPAPLPLGRRWTPIALAWLTGLCAVGVGIPAGTIAWWAVRAFRADGIATWTAAAASGSLGTSLAAALIAVAFATPLALWAARHPSPLSRWIERIAFAGYALPGLVVALALVFFVTRALGFLYQTLALLIAGYVIRFLPEAVAAMRSSVAALSPSFEDAARSLGERPAGILRTITIPLLRPGLLAGGGLVFLTAMKELPATLILRPTGFDTLATRIWTAVSELFYADAAVPSMLLVMLSAIPMYVLVIRPALAGGRS
ncbi:MAG TPA: iron ABC transporter permease [Thermoanaerobaculia bacterium]|nr:iron ABC transporter permease [Thermoanaerobaculia bacterium]